MGCHVFMFLFTPLNLVVKKVADTPGVRLYLGSGMEWSGDIEEDVGMLSPIIVLSQSNRVHHSRSGINIFNI